MLNMIRMEIFHLFHTKSAYVVWISLFAFLAFSTYMTQAETEEMQKESRPAVQEEGALDGMLDGISDGLNQDEDLAEDEEEEGLTFGIAVEIPEKAPGGKVTVFDEAFGNIMGGVHALFLVIFAVLFASSDLQSGYVKHIAGQMEKRGPLICAKGVAMFLYVAVTMAVYPLFQAVYNRIIHGYLVWGDIGQMAVYLILQICLHFALMMIVATISILLRNNAVSMIFAIGITLGLMNIVYRWINCALRKVGIRDFDILKYSVMQNIGSLAMDPSRKVILLVLAVAAVFSAVMTTLGVIVFQKRDVC